jgi:hypothetical protein
LPLVSDDYTGSTIGLTYLPGDRYLYSWEQNDVIRDSQNRPVDFTDLEYAFLGGTGGLISPPGKITDNQAGSSYNHQIADRSPVSAVSSDGKVAIAWIRNVWNGEAQESLSNVFLAIYDPTNIANPVVGPLNLTNNTQWVGVGSENIPTFDSPQISLLSQNNYVIVWSDSRKIGGKDQDNVGIAIYSSAGQNIYSASKVPGLSSSGTISYQDPSVVGISSDQVFIGFVRADRFAYSFIPGYLVLDTSGNVELAETLIPGMQGFRPYSQQFMAGPLLLTWINPQDWQVYFVTVQSNSPYGITSGPTKLETPEGFSADLISLSQDDQGRAVVTWIEMENQQNLYYALIRYTGAVLTPPIEFYNANGASLTISKLGKSCAPYIGKLGVYLPLVPRE